MMERRPGPAAKEQANTSDFSNEEKAFFESAPVGGYEGYITPPAEAPKETPKSFSQQEEEFFTSDPAPEYTFIDDTISPEEEARLAEARAILAYEDAPTEEVPRLHAAETGFGALADNFFKEGEEKYGKYAPSEDPDDDGVKSASVNSDEQFDEEMEERKAA